MTPKQIDKLIVILDKFAAVAERWADVEYPKPENIPDAEIYRQGHPDEPDSKEAYSDLPEAEGRFEKRFRESHPEA